MTATEALLLDIADTSRRRSYGACRICGESTRGGFILTVGVHRAAEPGSTRRKRLAERGRTFCEGCTADVLRDLIEALEAVE